MKVVQLMELHLVVNQKKYLDNYLSKMDSNIIVKKSYMMVKQVNHLNVIFL